MTPASSRNQPSSSDAATVSQRYVVVEANLPRLDERPCAARALILAVAIMRRIAPKEPTMAAISPMPLDALRAPEELEPELEPELETGVGISDGAADGGRVRSTGVTAVTAESVVTSSKAVLVVEAAFFIAVTRSSLSSAASSRALATLLWNEEASSYVEEEIDTATSNVTVAAVARRRLRLRLRPRLRCCSRT